MATKTDMKCDASAMLFLGTLKDLYAEKDVSMDKRDEGQRREKEEDMKNYYDVQQRRRD
jgi:hypothetical protein